MFQKILTWIKSNYIKVLIGIAGIISLIGSIVLVGAIKSGSNKKKYDKKINAIEGQEKKDEKIITDTGYDGHNDNGTIK